MKLANNLMHETLHCRLKLGCLKKYFTTSTSHLSKKLAAEHLDNCCDRILLRHMNSHMRFSPNRKYLCVSTVFASVSSIVLLRYLTVTSPKHSRAYSTDIHNTGETETLVEAEMASKATISKELQKAKEDAVWGMFIADALAMPVHWFYNPSDIKSSYKHWITGYIAPNGKHPSSILRLSAVDGSGRGSSNSSSSVIGNVILHDKLDYWNGKNKNNHYHQGMSAGDNTLNSVMALNMLETMNSVDHDLTKPEKEVRGEVLRGYVKFMTSPGSHNDTYAESFHRAFFRDWVEAGKPADAQPLIDFAETRCKKMLADRPDHQLAVIGSLVPAIPWIIRNAHKTEKECAQSAVDFVKLTHPVATLVNFVDIYARLLHAVLNGKDLKDEILRVLGDSILGGPAKREMVLRVLDKVQSLKKGSEERLQVYQTVVSQLGSACYIEGALSSLLFLALDFHDDFEGGVLANANSGGENCHRGSALGALLAASASRKGKELPAALKNGLHSLKPGIAKALSDMHDGF